MTLACTIATPHQCRQPQNIQFRGREKKIQDTSCPDQLSFSTTASNCRQSQLVNSILYGEECIVAPALRARVPGPEGQGPYSVITEWLYRVPVTGLVKPIFSGTVRSFTVILSSQPRSGSVAKGDPVLMPHRSLGSLSCCSHSRGSGVTLTMRSENTEDVLWSSEF